MTKAAGLGSKPRHPRVSISVDQGVGEEFSLQAGRAGKILFAFTNEWLATASKISSEGGTPERAMDEWKVCSFFRDEEVVPLPSDFVEDLVEGLYEADRGEALRTFGILGDKLVCLLKIYAPDVEKLADLARGFTRIAPLKRLDIAKVNGDSIVLSVVGAGRKIEVTECAFEFVKSILNGYGYTITERELGAGTIRVEAKRLGEAAERKPVSVPA